MGEKVAVTGAGRFTDEERRGMAVALREMGRAGGTMEFLREVVEANEGSADLLALIGLRSVLGPGEIFDVLADAIDRPTCTALKERSTLTGWVTPFTSYRCSRCGAGNWADADSVTPYCPECGAEVVG